MGQHQSALAFNAEKAEIFAMTVHRPEKLAFLYAPHRILDEIFQVMTSRWASVNEVVEGGEHTFKFLGKVFPQQTYSERSLSTNLTIFEIVRALHIRGWNLTFRSNLTRFHNHQTFFFTHMPVIPAERPKMFCLMSKGKSWVYLTKPEASEVEEPLLLAATYGDENHSTHDFDNVEGNDGLQVYLYKSAWAGEEDQTTINTKKFVVEMFYQLEQKGYEYFGSGDAEDGLDPVYFIQNSPTKEGVTASHYWLLSLSKTDRIRLVHSSAFPDEDFERVKNIVRSNIVAHWSHGLHSEQEYCGAYEFTLKGSPWVPSGVDTIGARKFLAILYEDLNKGGWSLHCTLGFSPKKNEGSIIQIYRACVPRIVPHMCISMHQSDKLRLICCPTDLLQDVIRPLIMRFWPGGIQEDGERNGAYELKLKGNPWKQNATQFRGLMCFLLSALAHHGWVVISSAKVSRSHEAQVTPNLVSFPVFLHTIWLVKLSDGDVGVSTHSERPTRKVSRFLSFSK